MIALLLALLLQEPVPTTLTYLPPKDSKPADVEKAAKAVEKRCVEYGYKGVTAKAVNGEVAVSCETGITEAMKLRLWHFTLRACAKVEVVFLYPLTDKEAEQYAPGGPAPKGASWMKLKDGQSKLVLDGTASTINGKVIWRKRTEPEQKFGGSYSDGKAHFEFTEDISKTMKAQSDVTKRLHILMLIDGREAKSAGSVHWKEGAKKGSIVALWKCEEAEDELGGICLNTPLPFSLELKK